MSLPSGRPPARAADVLQTLRDKRLLWPGIATLVGVVLLVGLGSWQMRRLAWKQALIAVIAERAHAAPVAVDAAEERAASGEEVE